MRRVRPSSRAGFSAVELAIAGALLALLLCKVAIAIRYSLSFATTESARMSVDDAAGELLERVERALLGASRDAIAPLVAAPLYADGLSFRVCFGVENGEVTWGPTEAIGLSQDEPGVMQWRRDPDTADETRAVWTRLVRPLLEGERANGVDDNDNGLVDEQGLTFVVDGRAIRMRLTLGSRDGSTVTHERTVAATIVPRNFDDARSGVDLPLREPGP